MVSDIGHEGQPIISKPFPVGEKSVLTAFHNLSLQENPAGAEAAANEERNILFQTNRNVSGYLTTLLYNAPERVGDEILWGALISHRALREEAELKGVKLPKLTKDFVEEYDKKKAESIIAIARDQKVTLPEAALILRRKELVEFEIREVEFSKIIRKKLGFNSDWQPEQDTKYLGIVHMHSLFRERYKDPKNFEQ